MAASSEKPRDVLLEISQSLPPASEPDPNQRDNWVRFFAQDPVSIERLGGQERADELWAQNGKLHDFDGPGLPAQPAERAKEGAPVVVVDLSLSPWQLLKSFFNPKNLNAQAQIEAGIVGRIL